MSSPRATPGPWLLMPGWRLKLMRCQTQRWLSSKCALASVAPCPHSLPQTLGSTPQLPDCPKGLCLLTFLPWLMLLLLFRTPFPTPTLPTLRHYFRWDQFQTFPAFTYIPQAETGPSRASTFRHLTVSVSLPLSSLLLIVCLHLAITSRTEGTLLIIT